MRESVDFGKTAEEYARYRTGFPEEFYDRVFAAGYVRAGDQLVDLGTGTGTVARNFAKRGCVVTALDKSRPLLDEAKGLDQKERLDSIRYKEAFAEDTGLPSETFDVITAGQCWHWFDRPKAAAEATRVLRKGGRILIMHVDWIPLPGNVVEATEALIVKHNPEFGPKLVGGAGLHPKWLADLAIAGFRSIETFSFDKDLAFDHAHWRGRLRTCAGVGATLAPPAVKAFDADLGAVLKARFPEEPMHVPHRIWAVTACKPT